MNTPTNTNPLRLWLERQNRSVPWLVERLADLGLERTRAAVYLWLNGTIPPDEVTDALEQITNGVVTRRRLRDTLKETG